MSGTYEKSYSFESDFSYGGFSVDKVLISITNERANQRFQDIEDDSICINRKNAAQIRDIIQREEPQKTYNPATNYAPLAFSLSFLSRRTNQIHNAGAGLNWGQPTATRTRKDLNAAYLAVPTSLQKSELLPQSNQNFACKFEDGVEIDMIRTGSGGKNLTSAYDNQIFGRYIRYKLGLAPGKLITQSDLTKASVTGLIFYEINKNSYIVKFERLQSINMILLR